MLKNTNKRKLKLNFKAARHLWELFFQRTKPQLFPATKGLEENKLSQQKKGAAIVPAVISAAGDYRHGGRLLLPPTPPKMPPLAVTGKEHAYSFTLSGK